MSPADKASASYLASLQPTPPLDDRRSPSPRVFSAGDGQSSSSFTGDDRRRTTTGRARASRSATAPPRLLETSRDPARVRPCAVRAPGRAGGASCLVPANAGSMQWTDTMLTTRPSRRGRVRLRAISAGSPSALPSGGGGCQCLPSPGRSPVLSPASDRAMMVIENPAAGVKDLEAAAADDALPQTMLCRRRRLICQYKRSSAAARTLHIYTCALSVASLGASGSANLLESPLERRPLSNLCVCVCELCGAS